MTPPSALASVPVHEGIEDWLAAAVTDDVSPEERALFDAHLTGCARCRELLAEETAMNLTIQHAFDAVRPLPGFERRLTAAFRQRQSASLGERLRAFAANAWRFPAVRVLGAFAVVLALISLGQGLTRKPSSPGSNGLALSKETEIDTGPVLGQTVQELIVPRPQSGAAGGIAHAAMDRGTVEFPLAAKETARRINAGEGGVTLGMSQPSLLASSDKQFTGNYKSSPGNTNVDGSDAAGGVVNLNRDTSFAEGNKRAFGMVSAASRAKGAADQPTVSSMPVAAPPPPEPPAQPPTAPTAPDSRKLIRNASVSLEVAAYDPAVDALGAAATQVGGGYVATADSTRLPNGKRRGSIVIKVLPDKLDAFLARLHDLGEIKSQNIGTEDITKDYFDTDARLRNARRMEDRLLKILDEDKGKLSEILQVEKELGRVREDIEKMQGQLQLYDSLVRYATVTIDLFEKDLKQPATFLLHQTAELSLLATDVEKTYAEARHIAEDSRAQIENSGLVRADDGRVTASLHLLLAPESADGAITRLKALARVENFKLTGERVAQNGDASDTAPTAGAKEERGPVTLNLAISHDETTHLQVSLTVTAADTSGAFDKARAAGLAAGAEIVSADFTRDQGPHGNGILVFRVPANKEAGLLDAVHGLGRTSDLHTQRDNDIAPDADLAPVLLTLHFADEAIERQISLTLFTPDLDAAFDKTRSAALAAGGEVTASSFNRVRGQGTAMLTLRLPARGEAPLLALVRGLGRSTNFQVQRDAAAPGNDQPDSGPVSLTVNFADHEPPIQQTSLKILCAAVEKRQAEALQIAAEAGAQAGSSTFTKGTDAGEEAALDFRLPMRAYPAFISRLRALGDVKDFNIHRQDSPATGLGSAQPTLANPDQNGPAEVSLQLYSQTRLVSDDAGLVATLRHTLAQGFGALMWSLRMIGVALAFLAPWVIALLVLVWVIRFAVRRRQSQRPPPGL